MKNRKPRKTRSARPTMAQVAALAGVSAQTVSRTMRNQDVVSAETRKRVQEAIDTLNFIPNAYARSLSSEGTKTVAVIIPTLSSPAYADEVNAVVDALRERQISVIIGNNGYNIALEEQLIATFFERRPDGVIVTGLEHSRRGEQLLRNAGVPVVEIWETDARPLDSAVGFNNFDVGYDVGRHFIETGRRRVAFVGGFYSGARGARRHHGLQAALRQVGTEIAYTVKVAPPAPRQLLGVSAVHDIMENCPDVDAVFLDDDQLAIPALLECNRLGIAVPDRIAICGFGDFDISALLKPTLTSVRTPTREMGKAAAMILLERIDGNTTVSRAVTIPHELVVRESTAGASRDGAPDTR